MKFLNIPLTAYHAAITLQPPRSGPYQCDMVNKPADSTKSLEHFRWFDGTHWSWPLDFDPDLDDEIVKPPQEKFIHDDEDAVLSMFAWRGYAEDPDPL